MGVIGVIVLVTRLAPLWPKNPDQKQVLVKFLFPACFESQAITTSAVFCSPWGHSRKLSATQQARPGTLPPAKWWNEAEL